MPNILESMKSEKEMLTLDFRGVDTHATNMFGGLGDKKGVEAFTNDALTWNNHKWGVSPEKFVTDENLKNFYRATSVSRGIKTNDEFVASFEGLNYPFMGV